MSSSSAPTFAPWLVATALFVAGCKDAPERELPGERAPAALATESRTESLPRPSAQPAAGATESPASDPTPEPAQTGLPSTASVGSEPSAPPSAAATEPASAEPAAAEPAVARIEDDSAAMAARLPEDVPGAEPELLPGSETDAAGAEGPKLDGALAAAGEPTPAAPAGEPTAAAAGGAPVPVAALAPPTGGTAPSEPIRPGAPPAAMPPVNQVRSDGSSAPAPTTAAVVLPGLDKALRKDITGPAAEAFYRLRDGRSAFVGSAVDGTWATNPDAATLVAMVKDLPTHAVDIADYHVDKVALGALPTLDAAVAAEARLASMLVRYVADFRVLRRIHPFRFTGPEDLPKFFRTEADRVAELAAKVFPDVAQGLERLWPNRPEYSVLRAALPIWRQKAAEEKQKGRPPAVPMKRIEPSKKKNKVVVALQDRLRFDGYYTGESTGFVDEATMAAVSAFQARHNLTVDGMPGLDTLRRFRETNQTKVKAIELSLQRWRESEVVRDGASEYIRVNIPGFQLELVENGAVQRRHRVIVGANKLDFNQEDWKQGFINRTPLLETVLYKLILNPTWIVPPRIRDGEILVEAGKNPSYMKKQGIHVRTMKDGSEKFVQSAGDHNVLGQVKFMLKKTDAVYLHDTNKRKLFAKSERAMSHGCMRLDQARDFAYLMADTRGNISREKVDAILERGDTTEVLLDRPIAVYVEYNSVGVDEAGELDFYLDVYGYDRAAAANDLPPSTYTRFGSGAMRPPGVPRIPEADYHRLRSQGPAPMRWPPDAAAPGTAVPVPDPRTP
ncbi:MAG: L,D-transpeptidase family protein [Myxococcales bacterium]|nr:L,D-transpeptidase family protein [Myxococcales bacterium]